METYTRAKKQSELNYDMEADTRKKMIQKII